MSKKLSKKQMKAAKGGTMPAPGVVAGVDVLKDAHASAVYGSRGQNGVILITTPKKSSKTLGAKIADGTTK